MTKFIAATASAALFLLAAPAAAQDPNLARNLAANCANCHGTSGHAVAHTAMTPLAGEDKERIVTRLQDFRAGTRPATVMHQIAKGYSDEQIDLIAGFLAAQKK